MLEWNILIFNTTDEKSHNTEGMKINESKSKTKSKTAWEKIMFQLKTPDSVATDAKCPEV